MRILSLDWDTAYQRDLATELEACGHRVEVLQRAADALARDAAHPYDLIVAETRLPDRNGLQFVRELKHARGKLPARVVFLSEVDSDEVRELCFQEGAARFLVKGDGWPAVVAEIHGVLAELGPTAAEAATPAAAPEPGGSAPERVFRGRLETIEVLDLVQLLNLSRKSGVLVLSGGPREGRIFFDEGEVVSARTGEIVGVPAFAALLALNRGGFRFEAGPVRVERTIQQPTSTLLLDVLRLQDEEERRSHSGAPGANAAGADAGDGGGEFDFEHADGDPAGDGWLYAGVAPPAAVGSPTAGAVPAAASPTADPSPEASPPAGFPLTAGPPAASTPEVPPGAGSAHGADVSPAAEAAGSVEGQRIAETPLAPEAVTTPAPAGTPGASAVRAGHVPQEDDGEPEASARSEGGAGVRVRTAAHRLLRRARRRSGEGDGRSHSRNGDGAEAGERTGISAAFLRRGLRPPTRSAMVAVLVVGGVLASGYVAFFSDRSPSAEDESSRAEARRLLRQAADDQARIDSLQQLVGEISAPLRGGEVLDPAAVERLSLLQAEIEDAEAARDAAWRAAGGNRAIPGREELLALGAAQGADVQGQRRSAMPSGEIALVAGLESAPGAAAEIATAPADAAGAAGAAEGGPSPLDPNPAGGELLPAGPAAAETSAEPQTASARGPAPVAEAPVRATEADGARALRRAAGAPAERRAAGVPAQRRAAGTAASDEGTPPPGPEAGGSPDASELDASAEQGGGAAEGSGPDAGGPAPEGDEPPAGPSSTGGTGPQPDPTPAEPDYSLTAIRAGPQFVPVEVTARLKSRIKPPYPRALADRQLGGTVTVWVLVDAAGRVRDVRVLRSSGYGELDRSATETLRRASYAPARRGGAAVPAWVQQQVVFKPSEGLLGSSLGGLSGTSR